MLEEIKDIKTEDLIDAYKKVNEFLKYLESEKNNIEK